MEVSFCRHDGGDPIFSFETNDLSGVIEAAKGGVRYHDESYEYVSHVLNNYAKGVQLVQQVIIYVQEPYSRKSGFFK